MAAHNPRRDTVPPASLDCSAVLISPSDALHTSLSPISSASGAPTSSSDSDPAEDGEREFSDVSSLRSYELDSDDEDVLLDASRRHGPGTSAWLEVGTGMSSRARTETTGSDYSSVSASSATTGSEALANSISLPPSSTASTGVSESKQDDANSLGGSYADLEPSLHSDPTVSNSTVSHRTASAKISPSVSAQGSPGASTGTVDAGYQLDFPDPANVSSSFTSTFSSLASLTPERTARSRSTQKRFRAPPVGGWMSELERDAGARGDGALSGEQSFISEATFGSYETPTASVRASKAWPRTSQREANVIDEKPVPTTPEHLGLPARVRVNIVGASPDPAVRKRIFNKLVALFGYLAPPGNSVVAMWTSVVASGEQTGPTFVDVHQESTDGPVEVDRPEKVYTEVSFDDMTRPAGHQPPDAHFAKLDRTLLQSFRRSDGAPLRSCATLVVELHDRAQPTGSQSADRQVAHAYWDHSGAGGLQLIHRLTVDISAEPEETGARMTLAELEQLDDSAARERVWGGILQSPAWKLQARELADEQERGEREAKKRAQEVKQWAARPAVVLLGAGLSFYLALRHIHLPLTTSTSHLATPHPAALTPPAPVFTASTTVFITLTTTAVVHQPTSTSFALPQTTTVEEIVPVKVEPLTQPVAFLPTQEHASPSSVAQEVLASSAAFALSAQHKKRKGIGRELALFPPFYHPCSSQHASSTGVASESLAAAPISPSLKPASPSALFSPTALSPTHEPNMTLLLESASIMLAEARLLVLQHLARAAANARAVSRAVALAATEAYESVGPYVVRAGELVEAVRAQGSALGKSVKKTLEEELFLARRGAERLARVAKALFVPSANASSAMPRPSTPLAQRPLQPLSYKLIREVRDVVHFSAERAAGDALRRGGASMRDRGRGRWADARRGLERLVRAAEGMKGEAGGKEAQEA